MLAASVRRNRGVCKRVAVVIIPGGGRPCPKDGLGHPGGLCRIRPDPSGGGERGTCGAGA